MHERPQRTLRACDARGCRPCARSKRSCPAQQRASARDSSANSGCIAFIEIAGLIAGAEPLLALCGRAVRPLLRLDPALRLSLDAIVAHCCGGIERLCDPGAGRGLEVPGIGGVPRPPAGEAGGLELNPRGLRVRSGLREQAELVLHVVAVLVGDDVPLGERAALRAEALRQFLEEAQVEVDLLVLRAIERAHRGLDEP